MTRQAFDAEGALDPATALILPSGGIDDLTGQLVTLSEQVRSETDCLGFWLGRHHAPSHGFLAGLGRSKAEWVTNFPSAFMFGDSFGRQMSEVKTGAVEEYTALQRIRAQGKRVMLSLTTGNPPPKDLEFDALLLVIRSAADLKLVGEGYNEKLRSGMSAQVPIVVHGGRDSHLPHAPLELGISAVLMLPNSTHGASSGYTRSSG